MKVDIVFIIIPLTLLVLILLAFKKKQVVVREIIEERPAPYWTFAYPNYWEWPVRDNTYYNPYLTYPYYTGPWSGSSYGYSGGIRTGGGGHHGGGGGHHGGGGGHHGGGGGHH